MATKRRALYTVERSTGSGALDWTGGDGWQAIPATYDHRPPSLSPNKINVTTVDDLVADGLFEQSMSGIQSVNDASFKLLLDRDDAIHEALVADMKLGTLRDYRFTLIGQTKKYGVRGQVTVQDDGSPSGDAVRATVTITGQKVNFDIA